jgi:hypothetical protein
VAVLAFDDAKKRVAEKKPELLGACIAQARARAQQEHIEVVEPAPALGFTPSRVFRLAVQCEQRLDV